MRLAATLVLVLAASALAEEPAQAYLRATNMLYQKLEYERALEQLARARKVAGGIEDDVQISLWEGILQSELGKSEDARTAFNTALALKVDAKLPVKVSPKMTEVFEKLRTDAKRELALSSPPAKVKKDEPKSAVEPTASGEVPVVAGQLTAASPDRFPRKAALVPFLVALAGAGVGVVGVVQAGTAAGRLRSERLGLEEAASLRELGSASQIAAVAGLGIGVAGVIAGTVMLLLGGPAEQPRVTLGPTPGGAAVFLNLEL